jgi:hypothetical protein
MSFAFCIIDANNARIKDQTEGLTVNFGEVRNSGQMLGRHVVFLK